MTRVPPTLSAADAADIAAVTGHGLADVPRLWASAAADLQFAVWGQVEARRAAAAAVASAPASGAHPTVAEAAAAVGSDLGAPPQPRADGPDARASPPPRRSGAAPPAPELDYPARPAPARAAAATPRSGAVALALSRGLGIASGAPARVAAPADPKPARAAPARVVPIRPAAPAFDAAEVRRVLEWLGPEPVTISAFDPERGPAAARTFRLPEQVEAAVAWARRMNEPGRNVYWNPNRVRDGFAGRKACRADVAAARFAYADVDPADPAGPGGYAAARARLLGEVPARAREIGATALVDSGNGLQILFRLAEPLPLGGPGAAERAEDFSRGLAAALGGDPVQNVDRVLRLPGTVNFANRRKIEKGYPAQAQSRTVFLDGPAWKLEDGLARFPAGPRPPATPAMVAEPEPRRLPEVRSALKKIDPDADRDTWLRTLMAVKAGLGDAGLPLAVAWSRGDLHGRRAEKFREGDVEERWASFKRGGVTLGTLFEYAKRAGWDGLTAEEEFRDAPPASAAAPDEFDDLLGSHRPATGLPWATTGDALLRPAPALPIPGADGPRYQLARKGKQVSVAKTPENVALYFAQDPRFTGAATLRLNVRRGVELNGVLLADVGYTALGAIVTRAIEWDAVPSAEHLYAGVQLAAAQRQYDPVREYLAGLRWDGVPRLDDWLARAGAEDSPATRLVGRRWMIGAAGRGLHEPQPRTPPEFAPSVDRGTKMDYCLVLEGPQGRKKSSVLEALCPEPYFFDSSFSFDSGRVKDLYQALGENFIVEMAELDALSRSDVLAAKAVITSRADKYRAPYARTIEAHPRRAALAGSSNRREWQRDLTGGRRFWPAWCPGELDARRVRENRDQLWAEAVHAYRAGEVYWEDERLRALVAPEQEERTDLPGWAHLVFPLLEANKARGVFTMEELIGRERGLANLSTNQVADVLRYFGCTGPYRVKEGGDVVRVWEQGGLGEPEVRRRVHAGVLRSAGFAGAPVFPEESPRALPEGGR